MFSVTLTDLIFLSSCFRSLRYTNFHASFEGGPLINFNLGYLVSRFARSSVSISATCLHSSNNSCMTRAEPDSNRMLNGVITAHNTIRLVGAEFVVV